MPGFTPGIPLEPEASLAPSSTTTLGPQIRIMTSAPRFAIPSFNLKLIQEIWFYYVFFKKLVKINVILKQK